MQHGRSCGIIPARKRSDGEWEFLILQARDNEGSWTFPKGFCEDGESDLETALRETEEEAGLRESDFQVLEKCVFYEEYDTTRYGTPIHKSNTYFLSLIKGDPKVSIQKSEIVQFKWMTHSEARTLFRYPSRQAVFDAAYTALNRLDE